MHHLAGRLACWVEENDLIVGVADSVNRFGMVRVAVF